MARMVSERMVDRTLLLNSYNRYTAHLFFNQKPVETIQRDFDNWGVFEARYRNSEWHRRSRSSFQKEIYRGWALPLAHPNFAFQLAPGATPASV